ncbi:zinc ABC transporter substrate-binding protein [Aquicoccus sp.]|uniref:zinc ABC transporter substrate-binding protein n=1 Tax=Aquicoccus sp. TaxID=2055851 RepID=UPI00356A8183
MLRYILPLLLTTLPATTLPARADAPRVATDLAAVQSLIAQVAGDQAEIGFFMRPGASPHGYAMRPSEAQLLQDADIVIWMGPDMSPGMTESIATLAPDATSLPLLDVPGAVLHSRRDRAVFVDAHDDDHGNDNDHDHDHGDQDHAHGDDHDHDHADENHAHDDDHAHDHGDTDPHAWLDPVNAQLWLGVIAETLAAANPDAADLYRANAAQARARLDGLQTDIAARLAPVQDRNFVVFHDAYQYFETRFGMSSTAAISPVDASSPGPRRLAELQEALEEHDVVCIFSEPQFDPGLVTTLTEGTPVRAAVIDPLGGDLEPGPDFYSALLTDLADTMAGCLSGSE